MMYQFALQIIIILIIISSVIAYIGNYVGRFFGKRRLSIFGLRPRNTATLFTIVSGMLIAVITFGTVVVFSRDARTAFFGLEKLRKQIRETRSEIEKAKLDLKLSADQLDKVKKEIEKYLAEIKEITKTKEKLKQEIEIATSRRVVYPAQEVMYAVLVRGGEGKVKAEEEMRSALNSLAAELKKYKAQPVKCDDDDYRATLGYLANMEEDIILQIIAEKNLTVGGTPYVKFSVKNKQLLFKKGDEIWKGAISGKLSQSEVESRLKDLISSAENLAVKNGLLSDFPGAMGTYPYPRIYDTVRRIRGFGTLTRVAVVAAADISSTGPFDIDFKVQP